METRRNRVITTGIILGLLGAMIPIATMAYASWIIAVRKDQDILKTLADQAIQRASDTFRDAENALDEVEAARLPSCSNDHIELMRRLTINAPSVEEIGYFENGVLKCTSWGATQETIRQSPIDFTTGQGLEVAIRVEPSASRGTRMIALHHGAHGALVKPSRFVDILMDDSMSLALTNDRGILINELNAPDRALVPAPLGKPEKGMTEDTIYAVSRRDDLVAIAMEPRSNVAEQVRRERILFLPAGAIVATFVVGIVAWLSKRRLSPLAELEIAVRKREFIVHYQPIVELKTGICVGAEALVRWRRPDGTLVRPDLFIPLAEESGLIMPITDQVIDAVMPIFARCLSRTEPCTSPLISAPTISSLGVFSRSSPASFGIRTSGPSRSGLRPPSAASSTSTRQRSLLPRRASAAIRWRSTISEPATPAFNICRAFPWTR